MCVCVSYGKDCSKSVARSDQIRSIAQSCLTLCGPYLFFAWNSKKHQEKAMAPRSSTLAWRVPWMEEPGGLQSMGLLRDTTEQLHFYFSLSCIGKGNGNPLQCSCLENSKGGEPGGLTSMGSHRVRHDWSDLAAAAAAARSITEQSVIFGREPSMCPHTSLYMNVHRSLIHSSLKL